MFSSGKKKPLAQVFRDGNSGNRFVNELVKSEDKFFNKSFDSAQSLMGKKPNLKQTQICIRRSLKRALGDTASCSFNTAEQLETKTELFLMPQPKPNDKKRKLNNTLLGEEPQSKKRKLEELEVTVPPALPNDNPMKKVQRTLKFSVGNVSFVLRMANMYRQINTLWDAYGKLIKVTKAKYRFEYKVLVRDTNDKGPILYCSYYDFDYKLETIPIGSNIRLVGSLKGSTCLYIFKIEYLNQPIAQSNFMRIQNVNAFVSAQAYSSIKENK